MHERILDMLRCRYDRAIINNTERGDYVECMIALALGKEWALTSEAGWDWEAWDCEHVETEARLEIKQSAARQSWDGASDPPRRSPKFDIASRKGFWPKQGGPWVAKPGRLADIYVFAWHGETGYHADHRKATQWRFFGLAERALPAGQSTIGLGGLEKIAKACGIAKLGDAVRHECPPRENLRAATTSLSGGMP